MASERELRLSPRSLPLFALGALKEITPLVVLGWFTGRIDFAELGFWLLFALLACVFGTIGWWFTRFRFGETDLHLKRGLVFRQHRQLPYARIQNLGLSRPLLHRLLGLTRVRVESAGGHGTEVDLDGLADADLEELRQRWQRATGTAPTEDPARADEQVLYRLYAADLVRLGLVDNRGMVVVAAGIAAWFQFSGGQWGWDEVQSLLSLLPGFGGLATDSPLWLVLLILAALVLLRLFSVLLAFLECHGFVLTRVGERLRVTQGLLTRRDLGTRLPRVQRLTLRHGWLHQRLGRVSVEAATAASVLPNERAEQLRRLLPVATPQRCRKVLPALFPEREWSGLCWHRLPRSALALELLVAWMLGSGILLAVAWLAPQALTAAAALAVGLLLVAWRGVENARWHVGPRLVAILRLGLNGRSVLVFRERIQAVRLSQGPLARRFGLARLELDLAGDPPFAGVTLGPLHAARARVLARELLAGRAGDGAGDPAPADSGSVIAGPA